LNSDAFVVMQVGAEESPERARADQIYEYVVEPALETHRVPAYRADLDKTPGAITPRMLDRLVNARLVIADLTGRNPNVFYELGIAHSFAKPLITLASKPEVLPFDAKDERIIPLGEWSDSTGLGVVQAKAARTALEESLEIVLADGFVPPSPLRDAAANRSLNDLAPDNPLAALASEMTQVRESLEEMRRQQGAGRTLPPAIVAEIRALRGMIDTYRTLLPEDALMQLSLQAGLSNAHREWIEKVIERRQANVKQSDPWATEPDRPATSSWTDEPPF
jgi:hypothetical protein